MDCSIEGAFKLYRSLLDQLPQRGFYVLFLKDGYSLIMPMTAVDTFEEAIAVPQREDHLKVILNGKRPYKLWWLGGEEIVLVAEYSTIEEMKLRQDAAFVELSCSGPNLAY